MQLPADTHLCSDCGYDLRGLTSPTHCPECGSTDVGDDVIVIWGQRAVGAQSITTLAAPAGRSMLITIIVVAAAFALLAVLAFLSNRPMVAFGPIMVCVIVSGSIVASAFAQRRRPPVRRWQLRISARGYGRRRRIGRIRLRQWKGGGGRPDRARPARWTGR